MGWWEGDGRVRCSRRSRVRNRAQRVPDQAEHLVFFVLQRFEGIDGAELLDSNKRFKSTRISIFPKVRSILSCSVKCGICVR